MTPSDRTSPDALTDLDGCVETEGGVDCSALFERLDLLLDEELEPAEREQLQAHLAACLPCAGRADFETQLRAVVREKCADQAPPELLARIRAKLDMPAS